MSILVPECNASNPNPHGLFLFWGGGGRVEAVRHDNGGNVRSPNNIVTKQGKEKESEKEKKK